MTGWLHLTERDAPLIVSIPHAGTEVPPDVTGLRDRDLAVHDADWYVDRLYAFAAELGATVLCTEISRTVIDLNRDPSGQSLYPGQATTGLCPLTTFDGDPLYLTGAEPGAAEITRRQKSYFDPYHAALAEQIGRLRDAHPAIVLYDAHSIRSSVERLFAGTLPLFNIGSFDGASCDPDLTRVIATQCQGGSYAINGRFKGGWITRNYGRPDQGVHAVQMELALRSYADEGKALASGNWPPPWDPARAVPTRRVLQAILNACVKFAKGA